VTDEKGALTQHLEYFPFGETWVDEQRGPDRVEIGFSGRELDEETGLLYFGARYDDPRLGQFLSVDPGSAGDPGALAGAGSAALNVYAFASGNPVRLRSTGGLGTGWWSRTNETFALQRGVGGADDGAAIFAGSDSPSSGALTGPAGDFVAAAGTGVIHDVHEAIGDLLRPDARLDRLSTNLSPRGPPSGGKGQTRARSNAVVGEGPARYLGKTAPLVIGENMEGRVTPYARSIGAETIVDWLAGRAWSPELNREFIEWGIAEGREFVDIGPDFGRRLQYHLHPPADRTGRPTYDVEREQIRGRGKRRQVYVRTGKFQGGVPNFDIVAKPGGGVQGVQP